MNVSSLLSELRRRRVVTGTGIISIMGWLVILVPATTLLIPMLAERTGRLVVAVFLFGIPPVLVLAWLFDVTPEGTAAQPLAQ
jgi:TRAP-type mannitol/chloroaromatic compound transport system permease large subunit